MKLEKGFEQVRDVGVTRVYFVRDEYFAQKSPQPQRLMLGRQYTEQGLVDGTYANVRQQRFLTAVGKPGRAVTGSTVVFLVAVTCVSLVGAFQGQGECRHGVGKDQ